MAKRTRAAVVSAKVDYRIRFEVDPDARFEECNGEARPLTREEYAENVYRGCPDHPQAGTVALPIGAAGATDATPLVGCRICGRSDYRDLTYAEYRAYYGDPDRHVYVQSRVQRQCPCCEQWMDTGGTGRIDLMDDAPELRALDRWFAADAIHQLPGYLREVAEQDVEEARHAAGDE